MYSLNSPSNQFHLQNCLFKSTNISLDFSRPLPPLPSSPRLPPPLSYQAGHNLPISVPELNEDTVFRASLDGHLDDIHYPANKIPDPRSSTKIPQISHHIISSLSPTSQSHHSQLTMAPPQLSRSATSPDLSTPSTISPISEIQEYTPNRNGAISRADRYSRVLPTVPPHPSTPPPPIPTVSSYSSNLFNSARPSGLRHVTFAHETDNLSLTSSHPSQSSSIPSSSLPAETPRKHRFNLTSAHQKMQKAFSTLRTHTHSISPKPSLLLRKKSSHSTLFGAGSSPLSTSTVSADEPTRPKTAPSSSSSSSFGFTSFPTMAAAFSKDSRNANIESGKEMQIGAPMGMVKKTPEEIQQMLREMGVKSEDLPFVSSASASASTVRAPSQSQIAGDGDGKDTGVTPSQPESIIQETPRILSAIQKGKLPSLPFPPHPFTRPLRSSSLSTPHHSPTIPFPVRDLTKKPVGWYSTASLDELRATLPPTRKEDLLKNDEIDGFLEELVRDLEVIKRVRGWREGEEEGEGVGKSEDRSENEDEDDKGDDDIEDDEKVDEEVDDEDEDSYIWGLNGEPHPDYIDGGWAQEETSSAGIGARWFVFDDTENILGGPKCPITHAVDGFEDAEVEVDRDGEEEEGEVVGYVADVNVDVNGGGGRGGMRATLLSPIEEGFGEEEGEGDFDEEGGERFDEDARQLTQEEILRREGLL
ncbi:uncharacterized protein EAE97_011111 [Botrytis byssoidea]|uniref:Uncharacterized protein n=1 Tax=Botrytis byssoidea TaxID=139641 RepID=A0A9P5HTJ1_9HELO|nr:uncharacterized protein EAE97_011111 [Botrytis byssoidea]KAF7922369.1 hypothetical protein EAE97_011111 [Botrytis byssoidea]